MGSNPSREISLLALLTPSWDPFFRYRRRTWGWDASGALEEKKRPRWPYLVFYKILGKRPILICINCNKYNCKQIVIKSFCIKYTFLSWMCRPKWLFLHMYGSHDMRHVDFRRLTGSQRTPRVQGITRVVNGPLVLGRHTN